MANATWLALTVMAHNLGRGVGILAGPDLHRAAILRRTLFPSPAAWCAPPAGHTCNYPPAGPGRPRSSPR